jgi:hypothetical protein
MRTEAKMAGEVNPPREPRPGDDMYTLPPLPLELATDLAGDPPDEDESNLLCHLISIWKYARENTLTPIQKTNLEAAFSNQCQTVLHTVEDDLILKGGVISPEKRFELLSEYETFARGILTEIRKILLTETLDGVSRIG